MDTKTIEVKGYKVPYIDIGEGEPVVFIPSMLVLLRTYKYTLKIFSRYFRVIAFQPPGSGMSKKLKNPWTFEEYAEFFNEFFKTLKLKNFTVIGHSNSAAAALIFSVLYPDKVKKLVLAGGVGAYYQNMFKVMLLRGLDGFIEFRLTFTGLHLILFNLLFHTKNFYYQAKISAEADLTDYAKKVKVPVLLAWGKKDHTMPVTCGEKFHQIIPESTLYVSEKACHDFPVTNPDEFLGIVKEFVLSTRS